jgi:hypothetical protein
MIKEFQKNLTAGIFTGKVTLALLQTGQNAGDGDVNCRAEAAGSAPSLVRPSGHVLQAACFGIEGDTFDVGSTHHQLRKKEKRNGYPQHETAGD